MASEHVIEEKKQGQALMTDDIKGNKKKLFIEVYCRHILFVYS